MTPASRVPSPAPAPWGSPPGQSLTFLPAPRGNQPPRSECRQRRGSHSRRVGWPGAPRPEPGWRGGLAEPRLRTVLRDTSRPQAPGSGTGRSATPGAAGPRPQKPANTPAALDGAGLRITAPSWPGPSPPGRAAAGPLPFPAPPAGEGLPRPLPVLPPPAGAGAQARDPPAAPQDNAQGPTFAAPPGGSGERRGAGSCGGGRPAAPGTA